MIARRTGVIAYLIEHVLNFSRVDAGVLIVDAPNDDLVDHAVLNIETHAIVAAEQFSQRLMILDVQTAN